MRTLRPASACQSDGILRSYEAGPCPRGAPAVRSRSRAAAPPAPARSSRAGRSAASTSARPPPQVRAALGPRLRRLPRLRTTTWYFTYRPFTREGLGVELTRNRVSAVYTLWQPPAGARRRGLAIGAVEAQVTTLAGPLVVAHVLRLRGTDEGHDRGADGVLHRRRQALGLRLFPRAARALPVIELATCRRRRGASTASPTARRSSPRARSTGSRRSAHLKAECFQRGGAFKFRGAYNKIASLPEHLRRRGVLAFSSGNHAQAVAIAAGLLGTHATILMPEDAPAAKPDATRGYGAERRHLRPLDGEPRGDRRPARGGARPRARASRTTTRS